MQKIILGAGCFWGVQYYFDQVPGVVRTTAGYSGGHTNNPTYERVCSHATGHAEVVLVEFDPAAVVSGGTEAAGMQGTGEQWTEPYKKYSGEVAAKPATHQSAALRILLRHFFRLHDPTQLNRQGPDIGDNYRSAIFYFTDLQKSLTESLIAELQVNYEMPIVTEVMPVGAFYVAEDYHQKFTERTGRGACHVPYEPLT